MAGSTVGAANIRLGADVTGLISNIRLATQSVSSFATGVNIGLTNAYRQADAASKQFRGGIARLGSDIQDIGKKMAIFGTLPALFAGGAAFKSFADMQKLTIGLKQYGETLNTVKELAKLPNISIEGAAKSLIQLRAVGVESSIAQRAIKAFGNAMTAAGKSSDDLNPALTNVVQFLSTGVVSAADVKELANRIPQTRKALMDAFGTASGEELTKIGPEKVVMGLIAQLEKIPPVAGGAGMAMEKFGDSSQFATATIGESIDKAFNLTKVISDLADIVGDVANSFADLSPKTQKFSLALAALAIAVPLVVTAIGAVVSAGAALAVGLGVAGASVALIASAVVVAGALIISNWDDIKSVLMDTGFWTTFGSIAQAAFDTLAGAFKVVASLLSGDWQNLWTGLKNVVAGAVNTLNSIMFGLVKQVSLVVGAIVGLLGMDTLGKWITEKAKGLDDVLKKLNIAQSTTPGQIGSARRTERRKNEQVKADNDNSALIAEKERLAKIKPVVDIASMSITELGNKLSDLESSYKSLKPSEEGYASKKVEIAKQVRQITNLIDSQSRTLENSKKKAKDVTDAYVAMSDAQFKIWSIDISMKAAEEQKSLKDKIKSYKELIGVVSNLTVGMLKLSNTTGSTIGNTLTDGVNKAKNILGGVGDRKTKNTLDQLNAQNEKDNSPYLNGSSVGGWKDVNPKYLDNGIKQYRDAANAAMSLNLDLAQSFDGLKAGIAESLGEGLGDVLSGTSIGLDDIGSKIFSIFGDLLTKIGKALIAYSTVITGLKKAIGTMNPWIALGAGILAIAAGKALKNNVADFGSNSTTRFAKGGFAYGEMNAIVGDNPNARFDPEMIAPYSKVHDSIVQSVKDSGMNGGGGWSQTHIELRGDIIRIALERANKKNNSLNGKNN